MNVAQIVLLAGWGSRAESMTQLAWWLAWATLVGALLQVAVQLPEVWRLAGPIKPSLQLQNESVRAVLRNLTPVVGALGVVQLSGFADGFLASFLATGSVSALSFANMIMSLPVALFGIAVSASSLPELSRVAESSPRPGRGGVLTTLTTEQRVAVQSRVQNGLARILFYVVPSAVVFIVFGDLVIGVLLVSGEFGSAQQALVHATLAAYAVGLVGFSANRLMATVFHAMQDYRTPLRFSMMSVAVSITTAAALAYYFRSNTFAVAGIALGAALGSWVNFALLTARIRSVFGTLFSRATRAAVVRVVLLTIVSTAVAWMVRESLPPLHRWIQAAAVLGVFSLLYLVLSWWLGSAEAARWLRLSPRRRANDEIE